MGKEMTTKYQCNNYITGYNPLVKTDTDINVFGTSITLQVVNF